MAITGTKAFTSGEILTSNDVNQYLMRGVKVFSSTAVRDAAYNGAGEPTLEEGETCFLADSDALQVYGGTALGWLSYPTTTQSGKVLQVVQTVKTDTFTTTSTTYVDLTGMSATITPTSATSKVLIFVHGMGGSGTTDGTVRIILLRDATQIALGDAGNNRSRVFNFGFQSVYHNAIRYLGGHFLDTPNTTSAVTYKLQMASSNAAHTATFNRSGNDGDEFKIGRTFSTITLMEISA
jgi:hypothetical protein